MGIYGKVIMAQAGVKFFQTPNPNSPFQTLILKVWHFCLHCHLCEFYINVHSQYGNKIRFFYKP